MPKDLIPFVSANLATAPIVSLLYGAFVVLAITSLALGLHRACKPSPTVPKGNKAALRKARLEFFKKPLTVGSIALFFSVTAHWINTFIRLFDAFVNFQGGKAPVAYYGDLSGTTNVVRTALVLTTLILCDAMIIYRLYVVWGYNKIVIIFPILSLMSLIACSVGIVYQFTKFVPGMNVFVSVAGRWIRSDAVFTLSQVHLAAVGSFLIVYLVYRTNIYSTVMISWRIWSVNRMTESLIRGTSSLMRVLSIFVESAALYTTWTIAFIISYELRSNIQFPIIDIGPSIAGISFMLINLRIGLGWAQQAPTTNASISRMQGTGRYQLGPMFAVNISQTVEDSTNPSLEDQDEGLPKKEEIGIDVEKGV